MEILAFETLHGVYKGGFNIANTIEHNSNPIIGIELEQIGVEIH
jgi:hypothetical protein